MMKSLLISSLFIIFSTSAFSGAPNFECKIFGPNNESGTFSLSGEDFSSQDFLLEFSDGRQKLKKFNGRAYLQGKSSFRELPKYAQKMILDGMKNSRRAGLKEGELVVYTNTQAQDASTLNAFLMPSGEIAFIQIGVSEVLCM